MSCRNGPGVVEKYLVLYSTVFCGSHSNPPELEFAILATNEFGKHPELESTNRISIEQYELWYSGMDLATNANERHPGACWLDNSVLEDSVVPLEALNLSDSEALRAFSETSASTASQLGTCQRLL